MDFYRDLPTIDQILNGNDEIELAHWVNELLITNHHSTSRDVKIKQLTELNYKQASIMMENEQKIRHLEFNFKYLQYHKITPVVHWEWPEGITGVMGMPRLSGYYFCEICRFMGRRSTFEAYPCEEREMAKDAKLKLVVNNDEDTDQELPLHLKTAGKGPTDKDWLSPMVCGTEFLARKNGHEPWILAEFMHGGKKEGNVLLIPNRAYNNPREWIWVDPVAFCRAFELRGVLEVPEDA